MFGVIRKLRSGNLWSTLISSLVILFLFLSCGDGSQNSSPALKTAAAPLSIRWHTAINTPDEAFSIAAASFDCQGNGVESVVCDVYDQAGNFLVQGGPFPCLDGTGTVGNIPAGADRTFVVFAEDAQNNILYHGTTPGITIEPDQTLESVIVDVYPFVPTLSAPANGAQPDPDAFALQWEPLENAAEYLVQISASNNFNTPIVDETTPEATYMPTTLDASTQYFWRISAVDQFTNIGAPSAVRNFTTGIPSGCTYDIDSFSNAFGPEGGTFNINVTASSANCTYTASPSNAWITITAGATGTGGGTVSYTVAPNPGGAERTGTITVGAEVHTITQAGTGCTYQLAPEAPTFTAAAQTGRITVTASDNTCEWTAVSNTPEWITVTSPASGVSITGNGRVDFSISANPTGADRVGTITVGGQTYTITQTAVTTCTYGISPLETSFTPASEEGIIRVTAAPSSCSWRATPSAGWIVITDGAAGSGDGIVAYMVTRNTGPLERRGTVTIGGQIHTVIQAGAAPACTYTIEPPTSAPFSSQGGTGQFTITPNPITCQWSAGTTDTWITITPPASGSGSGTISYTVGVYNGIAQRTGTITVAGQPYTITQNPIAPALTDQ